MPPRVSTDVPLAPLTTLELGGRARYLTEATGENDVLAALQWAAARALPTFVLGGGSNLLVPDAGFDGLVIRMISRAITFSPEGTVTAQAGEPWDALVAETVQRNLAGLENLSGIPGLVGATPIQNVGAYGQEVAETIRSVRVIDRATMVLSDLTNADCQFGYRHSRFKSAPHRFVVLAVTFALRPGGGPTLRYPELQQAVAADTQAAGAPAPSLGDVRATVLRLRRSKSMVIDPDDPNRRSVGSFFMNPVLASDDANRVIERLVTAGVATAPRDVPCFPAGEGQLKLSAAWLIERAGFAKGLRAGAVGVSTRHALALVHHGGGSTTQLLALADQIQETVAARFGVNLSREPVLMTSSAP